MNIKLLIQSFFIIILFSFCFNANKKSLSDEHKSELDSFLIKHSHVNSEDTVYLNEWNMVLANQYADSIRRKLSPEPLNEIHFDDKFIDCWIGGELVSMRRLIFQKIDDTEILLFLSKSEKESHITRPSEYKNNCPNKSNKYLFYSINDLAKERLNELGKNTDWKK